MTSHRIPGAARIPAACARDLARKAAALLAVLFALILTPSASWACACGCGVFDVGTSSLFPGCKGGTAFLEYDHLTQNRNRSGGGEAPAADNPDKRIASDFVLLGGQYMFTRSWGVMAEIPVTHRDFTTDDGTGAQTFRHGALGDIRVMGVYSGFSKDMSTGVLFGLKLPTGDFTYPDFDRDVGIGTGTTDAILGGYHLGSITKDAAWTYFMQATWQHAFAARAGYRPGDDFNGAFGVYYEPGSVGDKLAVTPVIQVLGSHRNRDSGPNADPDNTGYDRVMIAPGVELKAKAWKLYGDVEFPVYQTVNGDQLVAPAMFKLILSRSF